MYLVTAATQFEMQPFLESISGLKVQSLVTGVGPVETAVRLMALLSGDAERFRGVVNFGVAGAYQHQGGRPGADLLDICLAESEVFGDLGVCLGEEIERITGRELEVPDFFAMDADMLDQAARALQSGKISFHTGNFVTVNCTSGTAARGNALAIQHQGLCENMEGAAVARVCSEFSLPCLEVRCVSNFVEDRDTTGWKLKQACHRSGEAAAMIVGFMAEQNND